MMGLPTALSLAEGPGGRRGSHRPSSGVCWTPRIGVVFAETWDFGDALGGHASNHYGIQSVTHQSTVGGPWQPAAWDASEPCDVKPAPGVFQCDVTGIQKLEAWTNR